MSQYPHLSIVIPAYNESARIPATLQEVVACIRSRGWNAELIVVNDGSTDSTANVVLEFAKANPEVRLRGPLRRSGCWRIRATAARGTVSGRACCRRWARL